MKTRPFVVLFLLLLSVTVGFAYSNAEHIVGTVQAMSAGSIMVEPAGAHPAIVVILVLPTTKLLKDGVEVSFTELAIGTQVVVNARARAKKLYAVTISFSNNPAHQNMEHSVPRRMPSYESHQQSGSSLLLQS